MMDKRVKYNAIRANASQANRTLEHLELSLRRNQEQSSELNKAAHIDHRHSNNVLSLVYIYIYCFGLVIAILSLIIELVYHYFTKDKLTKANRLDSG